MARIPVLGFDPATAARDAWERAGRQTGTSGPWVHAASAAANLALIDAGIVAEPIVVTDADLRAAAREDLDALEGASWLPGVVVRTSFDGGRRSVTIGPATPSVTSIP